MQPQTPWKRTDLIGRNPEMVRWELDRLRKQTPEERARVLFGLIEASRIMRNKTRDLRRD